MNAVVVRTAARTAWLLASSRILGSDPGLVNRDAFIETLGDLGITADAPRLSRWESGTHPVPASVVTAYERALDRAPGLFQSIGSGLDRALGDAQGRSAAARGVPDTDDLDDLLTTVDRGHPTGDDWLGLAVELGRYQHVYLRPQAWAEVTDRLVSELARSVGPAYVRRHHAAARMITEPLTQRHLVRAIGRFVTDPAAQIVAAPITLLQDVPDDAAGHLVLRLIGSDNRALRRAATSVAACKVARGHFSPDELDQLVDRADQWLRGSDLDRMTDAFDLASQLPDAHYARVRLAKRGPALGGQLDAAREQGELLTSDVTRPVARAVAGAAQSATSAPFTMEPDAMLRHLVREALFHVHKPRRQHASFLLAASPYARAVSHCLVPLAQDNNTFIAARAWSLLGYVGHGLRRDEVARLAMHESRPRLQARALVNLGMSGTDLAGDEVDRLTAIAREHAGKPPAFAALFALGMTGHPALGDFTAEGSEAQRAAAAWWERTGGAVIDDDVPAATAAPA